MKTNKQILTQKIKTKLRPIVESILNEETFDIDAKAVEISELCNYDVQIIADLFLEVLSNSNHHTLVKYLGRFFADLDRNGNKVEDTKLYQAGY